MQSSQPARSSLILGITLAASFVLGGCTAPLMLGTALFGGTAWIMSDKRTPGVQLEDHTIEIKAYNRAIELIGDKGHVVVTSFNRQVLLTGEVFNESDKRAVEQAARRVDNVASVNNELVVTWPSSSSERSNDMMLATKVRATLIDASNVPSQAFKVVVERGVVYLMGRVKAAEANKATELTRNIAGVRKVVRLLDIVAPDPADPALLPPRPTAPY
ncbi:BON domain-containing protein [Leptothrix ochracea]|uniref:BON domain-containing protein n=1 Tax=Leptothrix ochracea TaxID=735331 RepID=UPI0034E2EEB6